MIPSVLQLPHPSSLDFPSKTFKDSYIPQGHEFLDVIEDASFYLLQVGWVSCGKGRPKRFPAWPVGLSGGEKWACITTGLTGSMSYAPFWSFHHSKAGTSICECVRIWEWTGENLLCRGKDEQRLILRPCSSARMWIQLDRENNQNHNWKISMKVNVLTITLCSQLRQLSLPQEKIKNKGGGGVKDWGRRIPSTDDDLLMRDEFKSH